MVGIEIALNPSPNNRRASQQARSVARKSIVDVLKKDPKLLSAVAEDGLSVITVEDIAERDVKAQNAGDWLFTDGANIGTSESVSGLTASVAPPDKIQTTWLGGLLAPEQAQEAKGDASSSFSVFADFMGGLTNGTSSAETAAPKSVAFKSETVSSSTPLPSPPQPSPAPPPQPSAPQTSVPRSGTSAAPPVPAGSAEEAEWLRAVQSKWGDSLSVVPVSPLPHLSVLPSRPSSPLRCASRMLYPAHVPSVEKVEKGLANLQRRVRHFGMVADELDDDWADDMLLGGLSKQKSPLNYLLDQLKNSTPLPVLNHRRKRLKPRIMHQQPEKSELKSSTAPPPSRVVNLAIGEISRLFLKPTEKKIISLPASPTRPPPAPYNEEQTDDDVSVTTPPQLDDEESSISESPITLTAPVRKKVTISSGVPKTSKITTSSCQVCHNLRRSKYYADLLSEQEGALWALCAQCVSALFTSIPAQKLPNFVTIGSSPRELLWELSPRSCLPVKWRGITWPSAYHAVCAEYVDGIDLRQKIFACFDSEAVDDLLRRYDKRDPHWHETKDAKIRLILKEKVDNHPMLQHLIYAIKGKRIDFKLLAHDIEEHLWGNNNIVATVTMEIADEMIIDA